MQQVDCRKVQKSWMSGCPCKYVFLVSSPNDLGQDPSTFAAWGAWMILRSSCEDRPRRFSVLLCHGRGKTWKDRKVERQKRNDETIWNGLMARQDQKNSKEWRMGKVDFMSAGQVSLSIHIYIYYSIVFIARWSVHPLCIPPCLSSPPPRGTRMALAPGSETSLFSFVLNAKLMLKCSFEHVCFVPAILHRDLVGSNSRWGAEPSRSSRCNTSDFGPTPPINGLRSTAWEPGISEAQDLDDFDWKRNLKIKSPTLPPSHAHTHTHTHTHTHSHKDTNTHTHKDMKGFNFSRLGCFFATSKTNRWLKKLLAVCRYVFPDVHAVCCFPEQRVERIEQYHRVLLYLYKSLLHFLLHSRAYRYP